MKVRFAPRALREAERMKKWWRANRPDASDLFDEEIAAAMETIRRGAPSVGGRGRPALPVGRPEGARTEA
jgi:hypothetical protein